LLLGLIQERKSVTGKLLHQFGGDVKKLRRLFEGEIERSHTTIFTGADVSHRLPFAVPKTVEIHGGSYDADHIAAAVKRCRAHNWLWQKASWKPRDVTLEAETGRCSFDLTLADESGAFHLVKGGWKKDFCPICGWQLFESQDDHGSGCTNGPDWVCNECYEKFWQRPDFIAGSYSDIT
jgi:Clp amino terminal domain, pathogenicity island component